MGHHQKRLAAPQNWRVPRKLNKWITKPRAGAHARDAAIPLDVALRDYLGVVLTGREARRVIGAGDVMVDGRIVKDHKFAIGYFDIVSLPKEKKSWRVLVDRRGRITLDAIADAEAGFKLARIQNKTTIKGGLTQLNLHDGRNIVVVKDEYKTGDTLKIAVPSQEIQGAIPLKTGGLCLIMGGRHAGEVATLDDIVVKRISGENIAALKRGDATLRTVKGYVFAIGAKKSEITLPAGVSQ